MQRMILGLLIMVNTVGWAYAEESNRDVVREELENGGWTVAYGKTFVEADWIVAAGELAKSIAVGNPGPFIIWMQGEVEANAVKISSQFQGIARDEVVNLVTQSLKGNKRVTLRNLDFQAGIATYKRWERIVLDVPTEVNFRGIRTKIVTERVDKTINYPNWHQPYIRFRHKNREIISAKLGDGIRTNYLEKRAGETGNSAQQWRLETVDETFTLFINNRASKETKVNMVLDYGDKDLCYMESQRGETGNRAQRWSIKDIGNGEFLIENLRLSLAQGEPYVLDYHTDSKDVYLERQQGAKGNEAQRWRFRDAGNGWKTIENVRASKNGSPIVLDWKD